jgi:4-diphosphocytidyl-2C-methyl-D-erythritol kinase
MSNDIEMKAEETVRMQEQFGQFNKFMSGTGGTLHINSEQELNAVPKLAWQLSQQTQKPVVIVVRAK